MIGTVLLFVDRTHPADHSIQVTRLKSMLRASGFRVIRHNIERDGGLGRLQLLMAAEFSVYGEWSKENLNGICKVFAFGPRFKEERTVAKSATVETCVA